MISAERRGPSPAAGINPRLALLFGQSTFFGLLLAMNIIGGMALFLPSFGSAALPTVYIVVAVLGSALFYGYSELLRRFSLNRVAVATLGIIALWYLWAWLGITRGRLSWIPFGLMVSFSLIIQMGFVLLGAQAGRLFNVREVKRLFPRVVAGFVLGFLIGGFIAPPLSSALNGAAGLALSAAVFAVLMLVFLLATVRRYRGEIGAAAPGILAGSRRPARSKPLWQLLTKRFVLFIVLYQMLSAMASNLLDYTLMAQAAERYATSEALTQFMGRFTVAINASDLLFLLVFAGTLLARFGLNFGLAANPVVDGILVAAEMVVLLVSGAANPLFFWLVVLARIADISFTDGTTRGSINTAFQALPSDERMVVQTGVEGIGVPVALGLTGAVLLIFNAFGGLNIGHVVAFTLVVIVFWAIAALLTFREYSAALIQTLRRRALEPAELSLVDSASLAAVLRLIGSEKLRDVRLALDMVEGAGLPSLNEHLVRLAQHPISDIRVEALRRIERLRVSDAADVVRRTIEEEVNGAVRGAALRAHAALNEAESVDAIKPYLAHGDGEVRLGAAVALLRHGGIDGVLAAGAMLAELKDAPDAAQRAFVARAIGEVGEQSFYEPLITLLGDADRGVRCEALLAAGKVRHPRLLPALVEHLDRAETRSAAMAALQPFGEEVLPYVKNALAEPGAAGARRVLALVRLAGLVKGEQAIAVLKEHIDHPDGEIREQVMVSLLYCGYRADADEIEPAFKREAREAADVLAAAADVEGDAAMLPLQRALGDAFKMIRRRAFLLLSFVYDAGATMQAAQWLESDSGTTQAMALEMLDVNLSAEHKKKLFPLLHPDLSAAERLDHIGDLVVVQRLPRVERLRQLIECSTCGWRSEWVRVCAVYASGKLGEKALAGAVEGALNGSSGALRETADWALREIAPKHLKHNKLT